jgi:membrane fusion protein, multidrug efflux system
MKYVSSLAAVMIALSLLAVATAENIEVESAVLNLVAEIQVPANEAGPLTEVHVEEGMQVKAGELLAKPDDRDSALAVAKAQIALDHAVEQVANDVKLRLAKESHKLADLELKKAKGANQELERVISPTQMEKLSIELEKARLETEQAAKELALAKHTVNAARNELLIANRSLERRSIVAPIDGVVAEIRRHKGEWLQPGETIVRIVRNDRLRAEGFVHVDRLTTTLVGKQAILSVRLPGEQKREFRGAVTFVSPEANPINGQVRVWAELDNREGLLRPGLSASMTILPDSVASGN